MLGLSSMGARLATFASSAAIHVTIFAAFAGHGSTEGSSTASPVDLVIQIENDPPAPAAPLTAPEADPRAHAAKSSHVHAYPVPASHDATPHDPSLVHAPSLAAHVHDEPPRSAAPSDAVAAPVPAVVHFSVPIGTVSTYGGGDTRVGGSEHASGAGESAPLPESAADVMAKLVRGVTPPYPPEARAEDIEADVPMEIVVDQAGAVADARVVRHVGYGFDEAALQAIRAFRFSAAQRDGHPVRVRMKWSVVFRLK